MKLFKASVFTIVVLILCQTGYSAEKTILTIKGIGTVKADPENRLLIFTAANPGVVPMEFSVCWNELNWNEQKGWFEGSQKCIQSEVGGWQKPQFTAESKKIPLPHYRTVTITIGRYSNIARAVCRENDGQIGCLTIYKSGFTVLNCKDANPSAPLTPMTYSGNLAPPSTTVSVNPIYQITIKPSMTVAPEDTGKRATLYMYVVQKNGAAKLFSSQPIILGNEVEFNFGLKCIPTGMLSFPITVYVGYRLSDGTIRYNGYTITLTQ